MCRPEPHARRIVSRLSLSGGVLVYLLGLVVIATQPGRFWLGFTLATLPIVIGLLLRMYDSARSRTPGRSTV